MTTNVVKVTVLIDKDLFEEGRRLACKQKISPGRLFAEALREHVERQRNRAQWARVNAACSEGLDDLDRRVLRCAEKSRRGLAEGKW
ncbi:MAG: hypothetical protein AB1714_28875 [Acidobacteriota bacterium]